MISVRNIMRAGALSLIALTMMNCKQQQADPDYIGPSDIKVTDGVMTPEVLLSFGRLSDPQISPDGTKILYGVSYTSIEQDRSCRNIFVCNADGTGKVQLTKSGKSISCARWGLDGKSIYYIQEGQMWHAPLSGGKLGKAVKISDVPAGISEFKLSPDQTMVMYISTIKGPVKQASEMDKKYDKAKAYVTEDLMYRHWDHWVTETPRTYVAPIKGDKVGEGKDILGDDEPYELPTEPFGGCEQLDWSPDGQFIVYSCRKRAGIEYAFSTNSDIYIYNVTTGESVPVTNGGGYDTDPVWSPDGKRIAWVSMERDGYEADKQRLFVADLDDHGRHVEKVFELTTRFIYDVASPCWSPDSNELFFSSLSNGTQKIYRMGMNGNVTQVTGDDWQYDFTTPFHITIDPSTFAVTMLATYSSINMPTELVAVEQDGIELGYKQLSEENTHILQQLLEPTCESIWLETVDHQQMQCWVVYPPQFDSTKVYPAIEMCLGGPQGTNSQDWSYRWNYRLMAQQGYIVILPNRRGTTAFGQPWKEEISGDYCGLNMQDYMTAGRYLKDKPYVGKLAAVGASYGGYSVYYLAGIHGDLYDCFVAHAGIFDEKALWYTTEEMWFCNFDNGGRMEYSYTPGQVGPAGDGITFGGVQQASAPYAQGVEATARHYQHGSPDTQVTKWHTPILCTHGMMDYRIPYEQGMAAFNAARMMGCPAKLVVFPEENHWILKPQNSLFWHDTVYDWLAEWLR